MAKRKFIIVACDKSDAIKAFVEFNQIILMRKTDLRLRSIIGLAPIHIFVVEMVK